MFNDVALCHSGVEAASEWIFAHMGDDGWALVDMFGSFDSFSDFAAPLVLPTPKPSASASAATPPEDAIKTIEDMGFNRQQAIKALNSTVHQQ